MNTSKNGQEERDAKNNHGTCWMLQAAQFATFTGNSELIEFCRNRFKEVIVPQQIAVDGSFPLELTRTKPYGYCLFNLDVMSTVCQLLSTPGDNLFAFSLPDGRGFARAMAFMFPFIANRNSWPYARDDELLPGLARASTQSSLRRDFTGEARVFDPVAQTESGSYRGRNHSQLSDPATSTLGSPGSAILKLHRHQ